MISLHEEISVHRPRGECFDYVADFRSTAEWDATAYRAEKLSEGSVGLGTEFDVWCRLPIGSVRIRYIISEFEPGELVSLQASCALFEAVDTIRFRDDGDQTHIDYRADFSFRMPYAAAEKLLAAPMQRMGRKALQGLSDALTQSQIAPTASTGTRRADRLVWPGLALFSKLGYRRGRKRWGAISTSVKGKRMLITGASSGLGLASARALAERGAELILVMRDAQRGEKIVDDLRRETGNEAIELEIADLALMADVEALCERLLHDGRPLDVLVNNAGALFNPRQETAEGLERSFALLLLSPYRLTLGLLPLLDAAPEARVINVVSGGMYSQKLEVGKLQAGEENYSGSTAYARCKRALTVLTEEWAEAWASRGITVNAMHPGWANTPGVENALPAFHSITRAILRSPEEGADTIIWLAAAGEAAQVSGKLFLDREPRTTHLLSRTREDAAERQRLLDFLENFDEEQPRGANTRAAA